MVETTANPFAILLKFYHCHFRDKLAHGDLAKIARKYGRDGERPDLLQALRAKYASLAVPDCVAVEGELVAIVAERGAHIPHEYLQLLLCGNDSPGCPPVVHLRIYDASSEHFDPQRALDDKLIFTRNRFEKVECLDNVSKFKHLIGQLSKGALGDREEGAVPERKAHAKAVPERKAHAKAVDSGCIGDGDVSNKDGSNLLEKVAQSTVNITKASPFSFLLKCMKDKRRVRVLVRRLAGSRGCLTGYVRSFDRHLNLLLADCDEEYAPVRVLAKRRDVGGVYSYCEGGAHKRAVLRRFLAQVLVRGDNVILVSHLGGINNDDTHSGENRVRE